MNDWYVDLHSHILPGVDDGAESAIQALSMADAAYAEGIRVIIATPHFGLCNTGYDLDKAKVVFLDLKEDLFSCHENLQLYMGNEILYGPETTEALKQGNALTLAGSDYVLIEFFPGDSFSTLEKAVQSLTRAGYRPVIAHAERYECLRKHPEAVQELVHHGALIQINSSSLMKGLLDARYRFIKKLLKNDLVHFLGSDCHNDSGRKPEMKAAAGKLRQLAGEIRSEKILRGNGEKLLRNEPI